MPRLWRKPKTRWHLLLICLFPSPYSIFYACSKKDNIVGRNIEIFSRIALSNISIWKSCQSVKDLSWAVKPIFLTNASTTNRMRMFPWFYRHLFIELGSVSAQLSSFLRYWHDIRPNAIRRIDTVLPNPSLLAFTVKPYVWLSCNDLASSDITFWAI